MKSVQPNPLAPIALPDVNTSEGLFSRLLIVESRNPDHPSFDDATVKTGMQAMKAVVSNRLLKPALFGAPGGTTFLDIVTAPGQFAGFTKDSSGKLVIDAGLIALIDNVLTKANTGAPGKFHVFVRNAIDVATASVSDPFVALTKIGAQDVKGGGFGWRTEGSGSPGGSFVTIPANLNGILAGNQFFALKKNAF